MAAGTAVSQQPASTIYLTPRSLLVADGDTNAITTVNTVPAAVQWSVSIPPESPWLTVNTGTTGSGNGQIHFHVSPNSAGSIRCANVSVSGSNLVVCQKANPSFTLATLGSIYLTFGELGGSTGVPILSSTAPADTIPLSTVQWIALPSLPPGTAEIQFQVAPNTAAASRVGQVTYSDATVQISQAPYQSGLQNLVVGVVRDKNSGKPISGAQVFFYGSGYGYATADSNGMYRFTGNDLQSFGGALSGTLYVGAPGYFEGAWLSIPDLGSQTSLPVVRDVTLQPGGTMIFGIVKDAVSGAAVSGATIAFTRNPMSTYRGGGSTEVVTAAADGTYVIDSSYFNESGLSSGFSINLQVTAANYLGITRSVTFTGYPQNEDLVLTPTSGAVIKGTVTDRNTGQPIGGATVFFYGSGFGTVTADSSGRYTFTGNDLHSFGGGLSGLLYVGAPGYFEAAPMAIPDLGSQVSLPLVQNVSLKPGGVVVQGMVRDALTSAPVGGAEVSFSRFPMSTFRGGATTVAVSTAADGTYVIDSSNFNESGLTTGFSISLRANAALYLGASLNLSFSSYPENRDIQLTPVAGSAIEGTVTDRVTGKPLAGTRIFFYGSGYGYATANSNGLYSFKGTDLNSFGGGLSGNLYVGDAGYFEAPPVSVPDLGSQASLPLVRNVSLRPGGAVIRGTITDAATGAPISRAQVSFNRSPMSTYRGGAGTESVTTAADGTYAIDSSYFNESGLSSGFSINLMVNAVNYLGATRSVNFTSYPQTVDFGLASYIRLDPPSALLTPEQVTASFSIALQGQYASSPWTVSSQTSWITIQSVQTNATGGSVTYVASTNSSGQPRSGAIDITVQGSAQPSAAGLSRNERLSRVSPHPAISANPGATFSIQQIAPQAITFAALGNVPRGTAPFSISASASSGLPVTFASTNNAVCTVAGTTVTPQATGTCSITASQTGNASFTAATPVVQSFLVTDPTLCYMSQPNSTNVSDVQRVIHEALGILPVQHDLNQDGAVNITDIQVILNAAIGLGCSAI